MRFCEYMHMLEGGQYCKYPDFQCVYQGKKVVAEFMNTRNIVTICDLNLIETLELESLIKEMEKEADSDKRGQKDL